MFVKVKMNLVSGSKEAEEMVINLDYVTLLKRDKKGRLMLTFNAVSYLLHEDYEQTLLDAIGIDL